MRRGRTTFEQSLFDGAQASASDVTAFIGKATRAPRNIRKVPVRHAERGMPLRDMTVRPVHMSYFDLGDNQLDDLPDTGPSFEMGFSIFPNGVMSALELFYGDAVVHGELKSIEYFRSGGC
jgi:hypothetical protein